jgi:hypothetical protein
VTDVGLDMTLEQLIWGTADTMFGSNVEKADQFLSNISGDLTTSATEGNIYARGVVAALKMEMQLGVAARASESPARSLPPLKDLGFLFLHGDISSFAPDASRLAYYDPATSTVFARIENLPSLKMGASPDEVGAAVAQTIPATVTHEFYHYLFYRPSVAQSGFILEGEATAYGEYAEQEIRVGGATPEKDRLRILANRIAERPAADAQIVSEFRRLADARISAAPYTSLQCDFIGLLKTHYASESDRIPVEARLSLTPKLFQIASNRDLNYAEAWAVYHVAMASARDWPTVIDRIFQKLQSQQPLDESDQRELNTIGRDAVSWVKRADSSPERGCTNRPDSLEEVIHLHD